MLPVKTEQTNHNFGPPPGQEDEIGDLPCEFRDTDIGRIVYSTWAPSSGEREAIAAGQNIELGVGWLGSFPPVSLGVTPAGMPVAAAPREQRGVRRWLRRLVPS